MASLRKPFQGVWNIVRFNWQFYVLSLSGLIVLLLSACLVQESLQLCAAVACAAVFAVSLLSLLVSWYIYDLSGLYDLRWCGACKPVRADR